MKLPIFLIAVFLCSVLSAQRTDKKLEKKIRETIQGFNGDVGVYVKNLRTGKSVAINADTVFPTASIVKIPILIGIMNKVQKKELDLNQNFVYKDSLLYAGVDILGSFKNDEKIQLRKLIMLMLSMSDNTASLWLQSLAGGGSRINEIVDSLGYKNTRVNSRTAGRQEIWKIYGWGQTTPFEIASIFERIYNRQMISDTASIHMMRLLGRNYWDENALSQIPPTVQVFSKNGAVNEVRSEILLVNGKDPYVFCVMTKNNKDIRWTSDNEAWVLARKLSKLVWSHWGAH
jgi:beta-lactamase class A